MKLSEPTGTEECQSNSSEQDLASIAADLRKIEGFDSGSKSFLREPTLYFSILGIFAVCAATLLNSPTTFWITFCASSAFMVILHIVAERYLFKAKPENLIYDAPYEGSFVAIFGSILPGISFITYSIFALVSSARTNIPLELCKIALLLAVPFCNFVVWKTIRKRYIKKPRLIGMMNGVAVGLSATWTIILFKVLSTPAAAAGCKFGWMFLLSTSPFLLISALMLLVDLHLKTEKHIARITAAFASIGFVLSSLIAFTPAIHTMLTESTISEARNASSQNRAEAVSKLSAIASEDDIRPSENSIDGFSLSSLLIGKEGLERNQDQDMEIYFRLTGKPFHQKGQKPYSPSTWHPEDDRRTTIFIGDKAYGLAMSKSQMTGFLDAASLTGSLDWTISLYNSNNADADGRAEIVLPQGSVISGVSLWVNNHQQSINLVPTEIQNATMHVPTILSNTAGGKIILKHIPVTANGGESRVSLHITIPLSSCNNLAQASLPKIAASNFSQTKRMHLSLRASSEFVRTRTSKTRKTNKTYFFEDLLKDEMLEKTADYPIAVKITAPFQALAYKDENADKQYIIERSQTTKQIGPDQLAIVIDPSASMKQVAEEIKKCILTLPQKLHAVVYFARTQEIASHEKIKYLPLKTAANEINSELFEGGNDNSAVLRTAIENTAEKPNSVVLWIHGPQPVLFSEIENTPMDLIYPVKLVDLAIQEGPDKVTPALRLGSTDINKSCAYSKLDRSGSLENDLNALIKDWTVEKTVTKLVRVASQSPESATLVDAPETAQQVATLWAESQYRYLLESGRTTQAIALARHYEILTPDTEYILSLKSAQQLHPRSYKPEVSEEKISYVGNAVIKTKAIQKPVVIAGEKDQLEAVETVTPPQSSTPGPGLIGMPVDPRYGQSNEVGSLADYGYDTARDMSRAITLIVTVINSLFCLKNAYLSIKRNDKPGLGKSIALFIIVPTVVHLFGTFLINNFGGLGGGL